MSRRRLMMQTSEEQSENPILKNNLTIRALEDNLTVQFSGQEMEYCIDGDDSWIALEMNSKSKAINTGHTISVRASQTPSVSSTQGCGVFVVSKKFTLEGNVMSMYYGADAINQTSVPNYAFTALFSDNTTLISVSKDFLPATELGNRCYYRMFKNCTNMIAAPDLPFAGRLPSHCYTEMFYNTQVTYIKSMHILNSYMGNIYTSNWLYGVPAEGTFVKNKEAQWGDTGASGVPEGWTIILE